MSGQAIGIRQVVPTQREVSNDLLHMILADVIEVLRGVIAEVVPNPSLLERLHPDQDIRLAGVDAAGLRELARRLERCYAIAIEEQELSNARHATLVSISRYILRRLELYRGMGQA